MFGYLRLRWKIWRLEGRAGKDEHATAKAVGIAMARGASSQEIDEITGGGDEGVLRRRIHAAMSKYLVSKANRLVIPLPDWEDERFWSVNSEAGEPVLTRAGINELRSAIRAEKKAGQERFLAWVPGIIGILGAMIGLAAILLGKSK